MIHAVLGPCNSPLQPTATHRMTLQHTAKHCNTLQHKPWPCNGPRTATHCNALQHTTHCNTLRHTTTQDTAAPWPCNTPHTDNHESWRFDYTNIAATSLLQQHFCNNYIQVKSVKSVKSVKIEVRRCPISKVSKVHACVCV